MYRGRTRLLLVYPSARLTHYGTVDFPSNLNRRSILLDIAHDYVDKVEHFISVTDLPYIGLFAM